MRSLPAEGSAHGIASTRRRNNARGWTVGEEVAAVLVVIARPRVARFSPKARGTATEKMARLGSRSVIAAAHESATIFAADGGCQLAGGAAATHVGAVRVMSKTIVHQVGVSNCER